MPELPEMETYKRLLSPRVAGQMITGAEVQRPKSLNVDVEQFQRVVVHNRVMSIERRAKHLLFQLASGHVLVLHLMLGGWMFFGRDEDKPNRTVQVRLSFGERHLHFIGLRLGYLHLHTLPDALQLLSKLGPEPLHPGFDEQQLRKVLAGRRTNLKMTLVDQSVLSGIGNCYSDEICFYGGLMPTRRVSDLDDNELTRLYRSIRAVLTEAIDYGGYMEEPLYIGEDLSGGYNDRCKVYDNEGAPCLRCGHSIVKAEVSSRKCFYCANCQA